MERIILKTSRRSYVLNYGLCLVMLSFLILANAFLNPPLLMNYVIIALLLLIAVEPELNRIYRTFSIDDEKISEVKGILRKQTVTIPSSAVANTRMEKGVIGRLLKFGDVIVNGFGDYGQIEMRGIKRPDEVFKLMESHTIGSQITRKDA